MRILVNCDDPGCLVCRPVPDATYCQLSIENAYAQQMSHPHGDADVSTQQPTAKMTNDGNDDGFDGQHLVEKELYEVDKDDDETVQVGWTSTCKEI